MRIILTKGLPGCGKTTWAKNFIAERTTDYGEKWKRVNKDDLRAMMDFSKWSRENEDFVLMIRDFIIDFAMLEGVNIIVDDTNFSPKHEAKIRDAVHTHNTALLGPEKVEQYEVEIKDFTDVSIDTCIKRDLTRLNSVGEAVIRKMYNQYLKPKFEKVEQDPALPRCIICDIDGTLAHMKDRSPFEWKKVGTDIPDETIIGLLRTHQEDHDVGGLKIILFSGRDGSCRPETEQWLKDNLVDYDELHMREAGDMRKDSIVKKELFDAHIKGKYNVLFVLDDRDQVVQMWRDMGIKCLQVAEGAF